MRHKIIMSAAVVAGVAGLGLAAAPSGARPAEKVTVCHGTSSAKNPSVVIRVNANSLKNGHDDDVESCDAGPTTTETIPSPDN